LSTCSLAHPLLHSFPTRRSSDLTDRAACPVHQASPPGSASPATRQAAAARSPRRGESYALSLAGHGQRIEHRRDLLFRQDALFRSEEHTSELQSLRHLVCRLLLE